MAFGLGGFQGIPVLVGFCGKDVMAGEPAVSFRDPDRAIQLPEVIIADWLEGIAKAIPPLGLPDVPVLLFPDFGMGQRGNREPPVNCAAF